MRLNYWWDKCRKAVFLVIAGIILSAGIYYGGAFFYFALSLICLWAAYNPPRNLLYPSDDDE